MTLRQKLTVYWWMAAGTVILIYPCLRCAWHDTQSTVQYFGRPQRTIDAWDSAWLQSIYGNPEDGVSGQYALINPAGVQVPYMPGAWPPWRAYCWSAWRNSTNMLAREWGKT